MKLYNKNFLVEDKSGRSVKPYILNSEHIKNTWDLDETDWDDVSLHEFLTDSELGDVWKTNSVSIKYIDYNTN